MQARRAQRRGDAIPMNPSGESIRVVHPLFQTEGGGSIPTSPLQLHCGEINPRLAQSLNALWHSRLPNTHLGNIVGSKHSVCFAAEYQGIFYAVVMFSDPIARHHNGKGWAELRRFAIAFDAPLYSGSRILKIVCMLLKRKFPDLQKVISYQDTAVHLGTIYKAAGWKIAAVADHSNWGIHGTKHGKEKRPRNISPASGVKNRWELTL